MKRMLSAGLAVVVLVILLSPLTAVSASASIDQASDESLANAADSVITTEGWFSILWGDPPSGRGEPTEVYLLTDSAGKVTQLLISEEFLHQQGGVLALNKRFVEVTGAPVRATTSDNTLEAIRVQSIEPTNAAVGENAVAPLAIVGSKPWISILCKFSDIAAEPKTPAYFRNMYSSAYPGLDHYWREASFNQMNLAGSDATSRWYVLPHPRSYYVYDTNGDGTLDLDFLRATTDCTHVADPDVNFASFTGINMMFNSDLDGPAWGGSSYLALDGITRGWSSTWIPPWAYQRISLLTHEMGHGFGLPHSSGAYGQTYDNQWDVMSDPDSNCSRSTDATYGCLGQGTIAFHKDLLGWISSGRKYVVPLHGQATVDLEQLSLPGTSGDLMAEVPINGSSEHFYTVEARRRSGYDVKLPGEAIIIHEVDLSRSRPAFVVDADNNGDTGDAGAQWLPGETFTDPTAGIIITVNSATSSGFVVTIQNTGSEPLVVNTTAQKPGAVGDCTLGEAIDAANADMPVDGCRAGAGTETILLPAGDYILSAPDNTPGNANGLPVITSRIRVEGAGRDITTIRRASGAPAFRIFTITAGHALKLSGATLSGGDGGSAGGAIWNSGGLDVTSSRISGNRATDGGGIYITGGGAATLTDAIVEGNTGVGEGAGLRILGGVLTLTSTTVRKNEGQGVASIGSVTTIINSTFASNSGGAIYANSNVVNITGSTIRGNYSQSWAGGISCWYCTLNIQESALTWNTTTAGNGASAIFLGNSQSGNLTGSCLEGNGGTAVLVVGSSPIFDARNNWWGKANGPAGSGPGGGDAVGSNITFAPFLTTRPSSCLLGMNSRSYQPVLLR